LQVQHLAGPTPAVDSDDDAASLDEGDTDEVLQHMGAIDSEGNLDTQAAVQLVMTSDTRTPTSCASANLRRSYRIAQDTLRLKRYVEYSYN